MKLFAVVGVVVVDRPCAVDLLDQQHPGHGVRQGHVRQANALRGLGLEFGVQPIGATDDEGHIVALQLPLLELLFVMVKKEDIIHVAHVVAYLELLLGIHIELMQVDICKELARQIADGDAAPAFGVKV